MNAHKAYFVYHRSKFGRVSAEFDRSYTVIYCCIAFFDEIGAEEIVADSIVYTLKYENMPRGNPRSPPG